MPHYQKFSNTCRWRPGGTCERSSQGKSLTQSKAAGVKKIIELSNQIEVFVFGGV
jgi:hypothetical protein